MRFRNFLPLLFLYLFAIPAGLGFIFLWEGHVWVLSGAQIIFGALLLLVYRAGIRSAMKNFTPPPEIGKIVYMPLYFFLGGYFCAGIPLLVVFADRFFVLFCLYGVSMTSFFLTCLSGLVYVARSGREISGLDTRAPRLP